MAKKKHAPAPAPIVQSAAPAYASPQGSVATPYIPPNAGVTAPGGPYGPPSASPQGSTAFPANGAGGYGAPPPQAPKNPFINAAWLWQNGNQQSPMREIRCTVQGLRPAQGGNSKFPDKKGWYIDLLTAAGLAVTARMNEGDQRHQRMWAAFGANFQGRSIVVRLPHPGDATKALWTCDCA